MPSPGCTSLPPSRFTLPKDLLIEVSHEAYVDMKHLGLNGLVSLVVMVCRIDRVQCSFGMSLRHVLLGHCTDLSKFNIVDCVAFPHSEADVVKLLQYCSARNIAVVPRGVTSCCCRRVVCFVAHMCYVDIVRRRIVCDGRIITCGWNGDLVHWMAVYVRNSVVACLALKYSCLMV